MCNMLEYAKSTLIGNEWSKLMYSIRARILW
jgi:hypothetical protein